MVSGAVAAPLIIPRLEYVEPGMPKNMIDTNTVIEISCPNYSNAFIYYTTDGSKPTSRVSKTINTRTHKYKPSEGLLLRQGKRTIKAICVLNDGRESNIVTREFLVKWIPSESDEEDEEDEEVYKTLEESRAARSASNSVLRQPLEHTNRTISGRQSVGGDILVQRAQGNTVRSPYSTNGLSVDFSQYSSTNPRVVNTTKMNATTGPIGQLRENSLGERQFDMPPAPQLR